MISKDFLDKYLPVPTLDETILSLQSKLSAAGFVITNIKSGSVGYMLLKTIVQIYLELKTLARTQLNNLFVSHAPEGWLELSAADYSITRKAATKTQGKITLTRPTSTQAVKIKAGHVFKTDYDVNGASLCFLVTEATIFKLGDLACDVPVEAEYAGSAYNCAPGTITKTLINLESGADIISITNEDGWITKEGTDVEALETFRARVLNAWAALALIPTADSYKAAAEAVTGVLIAQVDDKHPRGQGTVDIIVTSSAGAASEALLADVTTAVNAIKGPYDNLLVKSSIVVSQNIAVTLQVPQYLSADGIAETAEGIVAQLLAVSADRQLNQLLVSDLIYSLRAGISILRNVIVTTPSADVVLDTDKVIVLGELTITVEGV